MGQFKPGTSGNPNGRPRGTRNAGFVLADKLSREEVAEVIAAVHVKAVDGDMTAAKIILDRLDPVPKGRATALGFAFSMLAPDEAIGRIMDTVADGALTPDEGKQLISMIEARSQLSVIPDLVSRLEALEANRK